MLDLNPGTGSSNPSLSSGESANHRSLPISRAGGHRDGPRRVADALCPNALMPLRETGAVSADLQGSAAASGDAVDSGTLQVNEKIPPWPRATTGNSRVRPISGH